MTEPRVHTYMAAEPGIFVNGYLLMYREAVRRLGADAVAAELAA
jgi:hypothetical protein